jgi:phytoene synthase
MSPAASTDDSLAWLRERLLVPGHPLALTLPYAPAARRAPLLALHGLIGEIAAVPGEVQDADVARRKLGWWRQALEEGLPHPVVKAWQASGGSARVPVPAFFPLIEAVATEIEPPRFEHGDAFDAHCRGVAGPMALLEARLVDPAFDPASATGDALQAMAGAGYRARIVRDLVIDARRHRWLVPLDAQAEHRITRQEVAAGEGGLRLQALVRDLAARVVIDLEAATGRVAPADAWRHRHVLLRHALDRRLARKLVRRPGRIARERVVSGGIGDALALWRRARTLRRRAPRP